MTKPTLGKAWALFYVFQQLTNKEAAPILTQPPSWEKTLHLTARRPFFKEKSLDLIQLTKDVLLC